MSKIYLSTYKTSVSKQPQKIISLVAEELNCAESDVRCLKKFNGTDLSNGDSVSDFFPQDVFVEEFDCNKLPYDFFIVVINGVKFVATLSTKNLPLVVFTVKRPCIIHATKRERRTKIQFTCPECGKLHSVSLDFDDYKEYVKIDGPLIQNAMPYLTAIEREQIISHNCPNCQEKIFRDIKL